MKQTRSIVIDGRGAAAPRLTTRNASGHLHQAGITVFVPKTVTAVQQRTADSAEAPSFTMSLHVLAYNLKAVRDQRPLARVR